MASSAFRKFERARIDSNDAMMALLVGSRLGSHTLALAEGSPHLLGTMFPAVDEIQRFNRSIRDARALIQSAERHLTFMAIPYALAVYADFLIDSILLARESGLDHEGDDPTKVQLDTIHSRLAGALRVDLSELPATHLRLFELLRLIRNRIIHRGGTTGSRLRTHYRQVLHEEDRREWRRIADRELALGDSSAQLPLEAPELRAALAVTKHLAESVSALLDRQVPTAIWAREAVREYRLSVGGDIRPNEVQSIVGFARMHYSHLDLADGEIQAALANIRKDGSSTD